MGNTRHAVIDLNREWRCNMLILWRSFKSREDSELGVRTKQPHDTTDLVPAIYRVSIGDPDIPTTSTFNDSDTSTALVFA